MTTARDLLRMIDPNGPPNARQLASFLGTKAFGYWQRMIDFIDRSYPATFSPDWLFSTNLGWALRYKKGKSFCTLIPEQKRLRVQIVLGADERAKIESQPDDLSAQTWEIYRKAKTYHDGKWLCLTVDSSQAFRDAVRLLAVKRKMKA